MEIWCFGWVVKGGDSKIEGLGDRDNEVNNVLKSFIDRWCECDLVVNGSYDC